jgi:DNA recombination protein RmuC
MTFDPMTLIAAVLATIAAAAAFLAIQSVRARVEHLRVLAEQALAGQRGEAESLRATLAATERALATAIGSAGGQLRLEVTTAIAEMRATTEQKLADIQAHVNEQLHAMGERQAAASGQLRLELTTAIGDMRTSMDLRLTDLRVGNEQKLTEIQTSVNEQLHAAVEKQMTVSFARVTEQFAAVQKAMGEMQAVGAQIGDIKRLFGNVKTRGGWGETQVRAMLDDILPEGAYETNWHPRADSRDAVEFAIIMPGHGGQRLRLPVDAKFPTENYERLLTAQDEADPEADRLARTALARQIRDEAKKLAEKYIVPTVTVEFAVMYLPTDGLYAEVARIPGLLDTIGREHHVIVLGPSLFPALLRTIHLGHITLSLEQKAEEVRRLLGITRGEMQKIDGVLEKLSNQASTMAKNLTLARRRTRAVEKTLTNVVTIEGPEAESILGLAEEQEEETE